MLTERLQHIGIVQQRMGQREWQLQKLRKMRPLDAEEARARRVCINWLESGLIGALTYKQLDCIFGEEDP